MGRPPQDENRRDKILEIALKILGKQGFSALSFQKIADQALVSQSTVMHYFKNKNDLLSEISTFVAFKNQSFVQSHESIKDNAEERLRKFLLLNFQWADKNPQYAQSIVLLSYLSIAHEEFQTIYNQRLKTVREKVLEILYAGLREKLFYFDEKNADELAAIFHNFLASAITNYLASGDLKEKKNFRHKVDLLIKSFLKK